MGKKSTKNIKMDTEQINKIIFITISRGSLIRNFFRTGIVGKLLDENIKVVILSPNYDDHKLFEDFKHKNLLFEPLISPKKLKFEGLIREFLKGAAFNLTIYVLHRYKIVGRHPSRFLYLPRMIFFAPLRYVPGFKKFIRFIDFKINPQKEHDYLFKKHSPDLVFSTTPHEEADIGVLKSAKRMGIKKVSMPKSWDNLSKILFSVKTDYMLVWSRFMKDQAIKLQDYKENEIIITGIPQFDYYTNKENLLSREEFCKKLNFNPKKKIILHASAGANCCSEIDYVKLLKQYIDDGELKDVQVLARPHLGYKMDIERLKEAEKYTGFAVDKSDEQSAKFKDNWDVSKNHLKNLFNSLYHADVCINAASTMTLDAIACGTPVINIKFDVRDDIDFGLSVKRLYFSDYVDALVKTNGTWVANSKGEFLNALRDILEKGKKEKPGTKTLLDYFVYKVDGKSTERVADSLIKMV